MNSENSTLLNWLTKIEKLHPSDIHLGLERILEVGNKANLFEFNCPVVTIAGTNGKGSTLTSLAKLLDGSQKKYGTYTSPHLLHFNERIRINGTIVSDETLCEAFSHIESLSKGIPLTYFEFTTLAALFIFQKAELDVLILEIGMGGRLDAVNAVSKNIAVLTSISYDHQAWLGDTLLDIAKEKAGIIQPKIPVVLSVEACQASIVEVLRENENPTLLEGREFGFHDDNQWFCKLRDKIISVPKNYLPVNSVSLAMATYTILEKGTIELPPLTHAVKNLENVGMIGRFHQIGLAGKNVIFDVSHNASGANWLANRLRLRTQVKKRIAIWASLSDKALDEIVAPLCEYIDVWYVAGLKETPRAAPINRLMEVLKKQRVDSIRSFETVEQAFLKAKQEIGSDDEIVIFGSFFTVAEGYKAAQLGNITRENNGLFYS